ncbi:AAA family ATPase [Chitinimonas sp. BJB300]|uniref:AAA family ATPase n=1 Tax=Chitinimonas sp. BJB300 TaxID=1559339 RepID=UPI000C0F0844|nr:AAA family ATPase [Chitinimonas sp. BJB300]PHV12077.1 ATP-binding protein [Chitinimonas sp. BJB300]TSJ87319.1 AAA family ATPase [Chitinimonas sp. BJB300]
MSITTIVIGESGTGKSASMRNLLPSDTLLIQSVKKPLPFRSSQWRRIETGQPTGGNIFVCDQSERIIKYMQRTTRKIIVLDDFQYILANEFMRRSAETGFQKFSDIGRHAWDILTAAAHLPDDVRVYILAHSQSDEFGNTKLKTIGKLLDEKITVEGMVSIVLRTLVRDGQYQFSTRNSGNDTVKTPMGLFEDEQIDNCLANVDKAICDYYGLEVQTLKAAA